MTMGTNTTREVKVEELENKLKQIENNNQKLSKDLDQAREHEKLRMMVHAEELRRAKAHCDKLDRIIDKTRKQASLATQRVQQVEKEVQEAQEKSTWFKHTDGKEGAKKPHKSLAILRSIF